MLTRSRGAALAEAGRPLQCPGRDAGDWDQGAATWRRVSCLHCPRTPRVDHPPAHSTGEPPESDPKPAFSQGLRDHGWGIRCRARGVLAGGPPRSPALPPRPTCDLPSPSSSPLHPHGPRPCCPRPRLAEPPNGEKPPGEGLGDWAQRPLPSAGTGRTQEKGALCALS